MSTIQADIADALRIADELDRLTENIRTYVPVSPSREDPAFAAFNLAGASVPAVRRIAGWLNMALKEIRG